MKLSTLISSKLISSKLHGSTRRGTALLALAVFGGCSADYDLSGKTDGAASDTAGEADDTGLPEDTGLPTDPAYYVVRADLAVVDNVASAQDAVVSIEVIDADLRRVDCVADVAAEFVTPGVADTDANLVWWEVSVRVSAAPCATLPSTLSLGVGELHPDARARLGTVNHDDIADSLYGAWLRADGGDPSVYGYAGTDDDLAGDDEALLPAPDGLYRLAPLYVVPLP
ncbi:MAG: hypothetical protein Q8P41_06145 [Pseudomonadota bacterium]|nr:hypothetical protein [Pseudomonadota bacterium]